MQPDQTKTQVTSVLLNDTDRYWPRAEILEKVNEWITSFPDHQPLEMEAIESAILSLAFDDNLIDESEGEVKLNMDRYAASVVAAEE